MPRPPMIRASATFITALPFNIQVESHTGKKLIHTMPQTNISSMASCQPSPICQPVIRVIRLGHITASDAIQSGKLIQ